jgi:catechol 2,3-dioxygenase-like lactoylglutathione lyase family enzyme
MSDFHHVGLTVRDIERSYAFYSEIVGLSVCDQDAALGTKQGADLRTEKSAGGMELLALRSDAFDKLTNAHGTEIKYVNLQSSDGSFIFQLIEYVKGKKGELELDHARAGSMHLSFFVDDVEVKYGELRERGDVQITSQIVELNATMRSFYICDPDGVPVEFMEIAK